MNAHQCNVEDAKDYVFQSMFRLEKQFRKENLSEFP